jgi:hypothetical protein
VEAEEDLTLQNNRLVGDDVIITSKGTMTRETQKYVAITQYKDITIQEKRSYFQ